ncbi:MAG: IclR family transcriptional regulator [Pyramidobacter sp.]|uniref:IclR family transcriptional regulator n=1 Tax=Pyramidobacter sp. TaxID=1943581 RepID=UPI002A7FD50E|nr:IclR family transcriptional regulator [Pyramidobacter sp.]MDY4033273.1 IclR family transcriptional regulator [Pyramidobacter sp.]
MNSTRNIMALIETLLADGGELGVRELGMRTGIPKSTVQRFLSGMEENGWVAQDKRTQGYRIGYKLLGQSNGWALRLALVNQSQELLKALCNQTGQSVSLCTLDGFSGLSVAASLPEDASALAGRRAKLFDLHAGAAGKALLAFAPEPLQKYIVYSEPKSYTSATITGSKELLAEIEKIREKRYAVSVEELVPETAEAAAPILNPDGTVMAVLAIGGAKNSVVPQFEAFRGVLQKAAARLRKSILDS